MPIKVMDDLFRGIKPVHTSDISIFEGRFFIYLEHLVFKYDIYLEPMAWLPQNKCRL